MHAPPRDSLDRTVTLPLLWTRLRLGGRTWSGRIEGCKDSLRTTSHVAANLVRDERLPKEREFSLSSALAAR
jgi:hypothetical protein